VVSRETLRFRLATHPDVKSLDHRRSPVVA
jgi:hypothetical protein